MKHVRIVTKSMPARAWWWTWFAPIIGEVPTLLGAFTKFEIPDIRDL